MLRIVTDGAGDIIPSWGKEYGIDVIPVNILFGEKSYLQGVELDNEGFYKLVEESKRIPKTSQPSPHQFVDSIEGSPKREIPSFRFTSHQNYQAPTPPASPPPKRSRKNSK